MALTLEDINSMPSDPDELNRHLLANGYITPPAPPPEAPPLIPPATVAPMAKPSSFYSGGTERDAGRPSVTRGENLEEQPEIGGTPPSAPPSLGPITPSGPANPLLAKIGGAPEIGGTPPTNAGGVGVAPMTPPVRPGPIPKVSAEEYAKNRPQITADPGKDPVLYGQQKLARDVYDSNRYAATTHGTLGKIGHVLGEIGQTAGAMINPAAVAQIPGTRGYRAQQLATDVGRLETAQKGETAQKTAASETALRAAQTEQIQKNMSKEDTAQTLEKDSAGNIIGWKDGKGQEHSLEEAGTPQAIKDEAEATGGKATIEKMDNGDIVQVTPGKGGAPAKANVVYKGNPKLKTEIRAIVGPDGHAHDQLFDVTAGSPTFGTSLKDLGRSKEDKPVSIAAELAKEKAGERLVIGHDANGTAYVVPKTQAAEMGLQNIAQANEGDRKDAGNNTSALNELGVKTRNLDTTLKALDQNAFQRGIIAMGMSHDTGTTADQLIKWVSSLGGSQQTQDFLIAAHNLRESALNLPKVMTGSSRMTEVQANALWKTVADGASRDSKYAKKQLQAFDEMVGRQWKKVPIVEGNDREYAYPEQHKNEARGLGDYRRGGGGGGGGEAAQAPPAGKVSVVDPQGKQHFVNEDKVDKFLKDPKYKGWTRGK